MRLDGHPLDLRIVDRFIDDHDTKNKKMLRESRQYGAGDLGAFPYWAIYDAEFWHDGECWILESIGEIHTFQVSGGRHEMATALNQATVAALLEDDAFCEVLTRDVEETWTP